MISRTLFCLMQSKWIVLSMTTQTTPSTREIKQHRPLVRDTAGINRSNRHCPTKAPAGGSDRPV
jgi:hypothetical protein